jgi:hypothetical protein
MAMSTMFLLTICGAIMAVAVLLTFTRPKT